LDKEAQTKKIILITAILLSVGFVNMTDPYIPQMESIGTYYVTGYDTCVYCCGKTDGITASGVPVTVSKTIAMKGVPFGTQIYIAGLGLFTVEDRGVPKGMIDIACNNHAECYAVTGHRKAYIVRYWPCS